ncbi:MAG: DUF3108 domain-containing protein [Prevotella sp.]|nr:DUF3108 domain-containing protein [Prevotella sp.]
MKKLLLIMTRQKGWVKCFLLFHLFTFSPLIASAQCGIENTAFKSGEELAYDLYFNWKFIWVKVGTAEMDTKMAKFEGKDAWKSYLITRGNPKLDKFFIMRDTLLSYCNPDLSPLYFRKGAQEGDSYYVDEIWYSYPHGNCQLKKHRITSSGEHLWKTTTYKSCIYDMMSIFLRARNFDASKMKKNETIPMPVSDAMGLSNSWLEYRGRENYKMSDTKEKFRCLVFSFYERENGKSKELLRFWVTDDDNHIPVRLDMFLSFGSAKAYLKSYKGIRSPMTAKIK